MVALLCLATSGCLGLGSPVPDVQRHQVFGPETRAPLTLEAASVTSAVKVSRSEAKRSVTHPFGAPELVGGLRQFGLARVTASGLAAEGAGPIPTYASRLAWVGVYEISKTGAHSCPGRPAPIPTDLAPIHQHYYFVVLVDAATGSQATWTQDMSGLLSRQCAGNTTPEAGNGTDVGWDRSPALPDPRTAGVATF